MVEVRKRQAKPVVSAGEGSGLKAVEDFQEKVEVYAKRFPDKIILPAFLSLGGFTDEAMQFCEAQGIGTAEGIVWQIGE